MTSQEYRTLLLLEYKVREISQEDFDKMLMCFAMKFYKEQIELNKK